MVLVLLRRCIAAATTPRNSIAFALALAVIAVWFTVSRSLPVSDRPGRHPAYHQESRCNGSDLAEMSRWMSTIPDDRPLALLSIPGTHDSAARFGGEQFQCQTMQIAAQLEAGIRALDIRCRHVGDTFMIYHAFVYQHIDFDNILQVCDQFLRRNPTETILMRVKREWIAESPAGTFERTFVRRYLNRYRDMIWTPNFVDNGGDNNRNQSTISSQEESVRRLTLGSVRGKVVILQDFDSTISVTDKDDEHHHRDNRLSSASASASTSSSSSSNIYGPQWKDTILQDDFTLITIWSLYSKWLKVKAHLGAANRSLVDNDYGRDRKFYVNFLSGSIGAKPYFVASGHTSWGTDAPRQYFGLVNSASPYRYEDFPRDKCMLGGRYCLVFFDGTNMLTYDRLIGSSSSSSAPRYRFVGIIYADFPGCGLIRAIIDVNKNL